MPASSYVVEFTSTSDPRESGSCGKTCRRACWLNFDAQPALDDNDVSLRICSSGIAFTSFRDFRFSIFDFRIGKLPIANRRSKIENQMAERIGIEPTSAVADRRRF